MIAEKRAPETPTFDLPVGWAGRLEAVDTFLTLLAKAVRQLHAYPLTSQVCVDAVNACRAHLSSLDGTDEIGLTVTPDALLLHDHPVGESASVKQELLRRLRRARVAAFSVQRDGTARDLTRFIANLLRCAETADRTLSVAELMAEDGVESIEVVVTARREVLPLGMTAPTQRDLVAHERRRREEAEHGKSRNVHLFPPHRGWIRLDPAESFEGITLSDLAILVDDPHRLAAMLQRLVEDPGTEGEEARDALTRRFSDVARLFAGLEPRLGHMLFAKLAQAVVAMETERRQGLLRTAILPAIFDGRPDATVLRYFPDADLADALCLLLDDGASAAPALLVSTLDQLSLEPERRATIAGLVEESLRARREGLEGLDPTTALMLDQHARRLTRIDAGARRSFVELAGFEFRLDDQAHAAIESVCAGIREVDGEVVELTCLANLVAIQPNPEKAEPFMRRAMTLAASLAAANRWDELASAVQRLSAITAALRDRRPEVVAVVESAMLDLATPEFAAALLTRHRDGPEGERLALWVLDGLGAAMAPSLLSLLAADSPNSAAAVSLMCERASLFAPMLVDGLATSPKGTRHHIARVLGHAGAGYEEFVGALIDTRDERSTREALRALSRIGTAKAASLTGGAARDSKGWMTTASVEALLRFSADAGAAAVRDLLAHRPFVLAHPDAASRLLARVATARDASFEPVLLGLRTLRFRFWNRQLVRVAGDAAALLAR